MELYQRGQPRLLMPMDHHVTFLGSNEIPRIYLSRAILDTGMIRYFCQVWRSWHTHDDRLA